MDSKYSKMSDEELKKMYDEFGSPFPNHSMVILSSSNKEIKLTKTKYLVNPDMNAALFSSIVRRNIKLDRSQGMFLFINNNVILNGNTTIREYYKKYNRSGILFISIQIENVFGNCPIVKKLRFSEYDEIIYI